MVVKIKDWFFTFVALAICSYLIVFLFIPALLKYWGVK